MGMRVFSLSDGNGGRRINQENPVIEELQRKQKNLFFGLSIRNIGQKLTFDEIGYPLPLSINAGATYWLADELVFTGDMSYEVDSPFIVRLGAEYTLLDLISFRVGMKYRLKNQVSLLHDGLSAGFGLKFKFIKVDYAIVPYGDLYTSHVISLGAKF